MNILRDGCYWAHFPRAGGLFRVIGGPRVSSLDRRVETLLSVLLPPPWIGHIYVGSSRHAPVSLVGSEWGAGVQGHPVGTENNGHNLGAKHGKNLRKSPAV